MPARDIYHDVVKRGLIKDGWTITHDPFPLRIGKLTLAADLGAERLISAEKELRKIVVEVKSFVGSSNIRDLQQALGQYMMYERVIQQLYPERILYLAVVEEVYETVFALEVSQLFLQDGFLRLIVLDAESEVITRWIPN